jgi:hypothetical protein
VSQLMLGVLAKSQLSLHDNISMIILTFKLKDPRDEDTIEI